MNEFSLKIHPSDLPHDEKERRLREVLDFLLRPRKVERSEKRVMGKKEDMTQALQKRHASIAPFAS